MRFAWLILACAGLYGAGKDSFRVIHVQIPMRDGVRLAANVFLPPGQARLPVILERTPYGKPSAPGPYLEFLTHGYAVVAQDVRGRYESEGLFNPLIQEPEDGSDTLDWIARQPWSDGKIGMVGGSYRGIAQWKAALTNNRHLKAIFPVVSGYDDYRDRFYSTGGAMKLGGRLLWMAENLKAPGYIPNFSRFVLHLPLRTADVAATGWPSEMFRAAVAHPSFDAFWRRISVKEAIDKIRIPVFSVGGWYDNFGQSDLEAFAALRKSSGANRTIIGPWPHSMSYVFPNVDFGPDAQIPIRRLQLEWFDRWLRGKDSELDETPPLRVFVMGANRWHEDTEWPPREARPVQFYLDSRAHANTVSGDGALSERPPRTAAVDQYVFDPTNPVPTVGGAVCCNPRIFPWGPMDQRKVEQRKDVLVYTTRPLRHDLDVIGPVQVVLYVASSARDTDFTAKLVDVAPDGSARNLTDGILRLRYRNSLERPELARPGEVYQIQIDAGVTANVFLKGHSIRLEISSSNFPRFDRNTNTGGDIATDTRLLKASQTVFHDRDRQSRLVLLIMPARSAFTTSSSRSPRVRALKPGSGHPN